MSASSKIEWTEATWNPVTGCTKISPGCAHCYAERMAKRLQAMGSPKYANGFRVTLHPEELDRPFHWRKPRMIFVCSMSDLFHPDVPDDFIEQVFETMRGAYWHTFQVLTKRARRMEEFTARRWAHWEWPENIWLGVTVENQQAADERIPHLFRTPAKVRFLSLEPLLGPVDLWRDPLDNDWAVVYEMFHWVIVGGESGPGARPMRAEWVRDIRDQCQAVGVPFFFKQWGGNRKVDGTWGGRMLDGKVYNEMPPVRPTPRVGAQ